MSHISFEQKIRNEPNGECQAQRVPCDRMTGTEVRETVVTTVWSTVEIRWKFSASLQWRWNSEISFSGILASRVLLAQKGVSQLTHTHPAAAIELYPWRSVQCFDFNFPENKVRRPSSAEKCVKNTTFSSLSFSETARTIRNRAPASNPTTHRVCALSAHNRMEPAKRAEEKNEQNTQRNLWNLLLTTLYAFGARQSAKRLNIEKSI